MYQNKFQILDKFEKIVFAVDRDGHLCFMNNFGRNLLNIEINDLSYNSSYLDFFTEESKEQVNQKINQLLNKGEITTDSFRVQLKKYYGLNCTLTLNSLFDSKGLQNVIIGEINLDQQEHVTWTKSLKQNCCSLLNNIPVGIYRTSIDGKIIFANKSFCTMFGIEDENMYEKFNVFDFYVQADYRRKALKNWIKGDTYSDEYEIKTVDGKVIFVKDKGTVVKKDGKVQYFDGVVEDITNKKQIENQLQEQNLSRNKFFSILSHDLKGSFGQFIGATDLILDEIDTFDNEQIENIVKLLNEQANRSYKLLENLLDWSKSQEGILKFQPEPIDIAVLINEIIEYYNQKAAKKSIELCTRVKMGTVVYADKYMLSTILRNLISNAIKFTYKHGKVTISGQFIPDMQNVGEKILEVSVSDTGMGIEKERLSDIFTLQGSYSTKGTENETGTGLGLALCKEFVEKHGGEIYVESKKDKGSTFIFLIP